MGSRGKIAKNRLPVEDTAPMAAVGISAKAAADERKWKAQSALETIERAESHKNDKALMKDVTALAKEKMSTLKKIC